MGKKHYEDRNLKFETLQLHVGQEQPDPVTDVHRCYRHPSIQNGQPHADCCGTHKKMYLRSVSQHSKVVSQHLQLVPEQPLLHMHFRHWHMQATIS